MSRLGLRLAAAFVLVVSVALAVLTARAVQTITTAQNAALQAAASDHLAAVQKIFDQEALGIATRLRPLADVRELRFRVQPGAPPPLPDANVETPSTGSPERSAGMLDPAGLQRFVEQILPVTGLDFVEVTALDGEILARGQYPEAFGEIRDDSTIAAAVCGQSSVLVRPELFRDTYHPALTVVLPVLAQAGDSRSAVAALSGGLRLDRLAERLGRLRGSIVVIATEAGIVASAPVPVAAAGLGLIRDGADFYWSGSTLLAAQGTVLGRLKVMVPASDAVRSRERLATETIRYGAVEVLVAALLGLLLSLGPTRRLAELTRAALRIGGGDLETSVAVHGHDEIGVLGRTLEETARALKNERERLVRSERVAAWRDAARKLAHELKNAITPIGLSLRTVQRAGEKGAEGREAATQSIAAIGVELTHLQSLVDEFSQFARLPAPRPVPCDLRASLVAAIHLYAAGGPSIRIVCPENLPSVAMDLELIGRVWSNLLSNAVTACGGAGGIEVAIESDAERGARVVITDSGPGLAAEQIRAAGKERVSTKPGGWGVGLALAERIVAEHGGEMTLENASSGGARVSVLLPWAGKEIS